jgi:hypothetical protein
MTTGEGFVCDEIGYGLIIAALDGFNGLIITMGLCRETFW